MLRMGLGCNRVCVKGSFNELDGGGLITELRLITFHARPAYDLRCFVSCCFHADLQHILQHWVETGRIVLPL